MHTGLSRSSQILYRILAHCIRNYKNLSIALILWHNKNSFPINRGVTHMQLGLLAPSVSEVSCHRAPSPLSFIFWPAVTQASCSPVPCVYWQTSIFDLWQLNGCEMLLFLHSLMRTRAPSVCMCLLTPSFLGLWSACSQPSLSFILLTFQYHPKQTDTQADLLRVIL